MSLDAKNGRRPFFRKMPVFLKSACVFLMKNSDKTRYFKGRLTSLCRADICPGKSSERSMVHADGDGRIGSKFHENTTIYYQFCDWRRFDQKFEGGQARWCKHRCIQSSIDLATPSSIVHWVVQLLQPRTPSHPHHRSHNKHAHAGSASHRPDHGLPSAGAPERAQQQYLPIDHAQCPRSWFLLPASQRLPTGAAVN
jgi:hypothetical protein